MTGAGQPECLRPGIVGWGLGALLVAATLVAYRHVWHAGFIWDDEMHVTINPCVVGPLGLREIWTTRQARYFPLTLTTFWAEHRLWGLNPAAFHLVNLACHGACALALWRALGLLRVRAAWLGAAFWALHPVQVETVAWVTELKNTQSGLFYLLAIISFLKWNTPEPPGAGRRGRWYGAALAFSALAMASKSSTTVLPIVLALCAWWTDGRLGRRVAVALLPVLALSLASAALTLWTQHLEGANDPEWARSVGERIAIAGRVPWFYLGKLAWPHPLIFIYPRWAVDASSPASFLPAAASALALLGLWLGRRGTLRPAFFAFAVFLAALLPVLGLFDQFFWRYSFVGDHFQYLASMAPLALAAAAISALFRRIALKRPGVRPALGTAVAGGAILLALASATTLQSATYSDIETLWRRTLAMNPACWIGYNNLGAHLMSTGRGAEAEGLFRQALALRPDQVAHNNLGEILEQSGRTGEALQHFRSAAAMDPEFAPPRFGLGHAYLRLGRLDSAAASYREALTLDPGNADGRINLGAALLGAGHPAEAAAEFRRALETRPAFAWAENDLGNALVQLGNRDEAILHYRRALEIDPSLPEAANNLGYALAESGRLDEAITQYRKAIALRPGYREAHRNLGIALFKKGDVLGADAEIDAAARAR
jgi:Flp pilus assembly protein TadD